MEGKMNNRISRRQFLRVSAFTAASLAAAACAQPAAPAAPAAEAESAAGGIPQGGIVRYKGSGGRTTYCLAPVVLRNHGLAQHDETGLARSGH